MLRHSSPHSNERGTALPAVLAVALGVGALALGYSARNIREHNRATFHRHSTEALYEAFGQVEIVANMVNVSPYDPATGRNMAVQTAMARADNQFIDRDGWPTGVIVQELGAPGSGLLEIVSEATIQGETRRVSAVIRERQSFADFNYFVESHPLGIAGGEDASFPYADAPEGSIHSNNKLIFYFEDRHFRDPVTAVEGFEYTAGARGPEDPSGENTWFHGPSNDASPRIDGLMEVDTSDFATRSDTLLALTGDYDYARVWLMEDQVRVDHYQHGHYELQDVTNAVELYHWESQQVQQEIWEQQLQQVQVVTPIYEWQDQQVCGWVSVQVWVPGGGGGAQGGGGGSGDVGYWETQSQWQCWTESVQVQIGTQTDWVDQWVWVPTGTYQTVTQWYKVHDGWDYVTTQQNVYIPAQFVATHTLPADGTIYVKGDIYMDRAYSWSHGNDIHVLDGNLSIASGDDILIRDSIQYAKRDGNGDLQSAYLNGNNKDEPYEPNPHYTGKSVLGLIANDRIEYQRYMPDQSEVNAALLAKGAQVAIDGVTIHSNGDVSEHYSGAFVKLSLRRLGGVTSNRRPVTSYVNGSNAVTRGFVYGKSVFDRRQITTPPRGFPTINRPRLVTYLLREVR